MHDSESRQAASYRTGALAAGCTLLGAVLSGPVALVFLALTYPQPPWQSVEIFARSHHPLQGLPYFLGFLLVGGFVTLVASLHACARAEHRARTSAAVAFSAAFSALVFLNYVIQTTLVPELVRTRDAGTDPLLAILTMSNPKSLGWGLEMWGYGLLGVATWLAAPVFEGSALERATAWMFVANGPLSILPAFWTAFAPGWELGVLGMISFATWNLLVIVMASLALVVFRRRLGARPLSASSFGRREPSVRATN